MLGFGTRGIWPNPGLGFPTRGVWGVVNAAQPLPAPASTLVSSVTRDSIYGGKSIQLRLMPKVALSGPLYDITFLPPSVRTASGAYVRTASGDYVLAPGAWTGTTSTHGGATYSALVSSATLTTGSYASGSSEVSTDSIIDSARLHAEGTLDPYYRYSASKVSPFYLQLGSLSSGTYAELRLSYDPAFSPSPYLLCTIAVGSTIVAQVKVVLGAKSTPLRNHTLSSLEIVRHGTFVAFMLDGALLLSSGSFTDATLPCTVGVSNESCARNINLTLSQLTVGSCALIEGRPLLSPQAPTIYGVTGVVPERVGHNAGVVDLELFGPWGSMESARGFSYFWPPARSIASSGGFGNAGKRLTVANLHK